MHMKLTTANIAIVRQWMFNRSSLVDPSPNSRDQINVKDPITGVKTKERKCFYKFSICEL